MEKSLIRSAYFQKRKELTSILITEKNQAILENLGDLLSEKNFGVIHIFLPQRGKMEIDTWQIISLLHRQFPQTHIAAPRVIPGTREMEHFLLTPKTTLIDSQWKIPEPDPKTSIGIQPEEIDAVIIPLLAFDKSGFRVGYGGGYYDRFLVQCRPDVVKIGLSFFDPVDKIEDINEFDIPMDLCVTPRSLIHF